MPVPTGSDGAGPGDVAGAGVDAWSVMLMITLLSSTEFFSSDRMRFSQALSTHRRVLLITQPVATEAGTALGRQNIRLSASGVCAVQ